MSPNSQEKFRPKTPPINQAKAKPQGQQGRPFARQTQAKGQQDQPDRSARLWNAKPPKARKAGKAKPGRIPARPAGQVKARRPDERKSKTGQRQSHQAKAGRLGKIGRTRQDLQARARRKSRTSRTEEGKAKRKKPSRWEKGFGFADGGCAAKEVRPSTTI